MALFKMQPIFATASFVAQKKFCIFSPWLLILATPTVSCLPNRCDVDPTRDDKGRLVTRDRRSGFGRCCRFVSQRRLHKDLSKNFLKNSKLFQTRRSLRSMLHQCKGRKFSIILQHTTVHCNKCRPQRLVQVVFTQRLLNEAQKQCPRNNTKHSE